MPDNYPPHIVEIDNDERLRVDSHNYVWNTNTLAWEKSTGGEVTGTNVNVTNFPALYPVSDNGGSLTVDSTQLPSTLTGSGNLRIALNETNIVQPISDNSGSITVDGIVSAIQSGTWDINNISGTVSLPTGAATETTLSTRLADSTFTGRINTQGQKLMITSTPVVLASDQTSIPVTDNSGSLTVDAPVGTPLAARLSDGTSFLTTSSGRLSVDASAVAVPVTDNGGSLTVDGIVSAVQSGTWTVQPGNTANTTAWVVTSKVDRIASAPTTAVVTTSSSTIVAANVSRTGLILRNTSGLNRIVSLGLDGNAAVASSGIVLNDGDIYYMSEFDFTTGAISAICNTGTGSLAVQEYS